MYDVEKVENAVYHARDSIFEAQDALHGPTDHNAEKAECISTIADKLRKIERLLVYLTSDVHELQRLESEEEHE